MRKALAITLLVILVLPSIGFAGSWRRYRYRQHDRPDPRTTRVYHSYHNNGAAIAAGVLGGIVTGVILDRILTPLQQLPQPMCCQEPASYYPPIPADSAHGDPYDRGYQQGYEQGVARGRAERYEQGQKQGYDQGLDDAASGRIWASSR